MEYCWHHINFFFIFVGESFGMSDFRILLHILIIFLEFFKMPKGGFGVNSQCPSLESPNSQSIKGVLSLRHRMIILLVFFIFKTSSPPPLFLLLILSCFGVSKVLEEGETNQLSKLLVGQYLQVPDLHLSLCGSSYRGQTTPYGYEQLEEYLLQPLDQRRSRSNLFGNDL